METALAPGLLILSPSVDFFPCPESSRERLLILAKKLEVLLPLAAEEVGGVEGLPLDGVGLSTLPLFLNKSMNLKLLR